MCLAEFALSLSSSTYLVSTDQRVTGLSVSLLVGVSVLLAPVLQLVPYAVLFGVFLYMGVSNINGIQFFDRLMLIFMPVKHHPQVSYVRRVSNAILAEVAFVVLS
jgi:solute carrier family 4 anion exchanger 2